MEIIKCGITDYKSSCHKNTQPNNGVSHAAKWFADHPELNPSKIFEGGGSLSLKSEFPYPTETKIEKPPDISSLDTATANLLQMSVPDPSTTFLDIGTDSSMYEDDPFKIENLLPSTFSMNQLDMGPNNNNNNNNDDSMLNHNSNDIAVNFSNKPHPHHVPNVHHHMRHHQLPKPVFLNHVAPSNGAPHSGAAPAGPAPLPLTSTHLPLRGANAAALIGMSALYPETTISAINHGHAPVALPSPARPIAPHGAAMIKSEPLPFIKKEDCGYDGSTPGVSPLSSMGSPGSPPGFAGAQQPHSSCGGKMKSSGVSNGGGARKKMVAQTPEEEELASIPSLQMRIKILQQRVG